MTNGICCWGPIAFADGVCSRGSVTFAEGVCGGSPVRGV